ncbi:hypothetical protein [Actibacterium sp. 188UL27-1]|uniref:hypothetical protein n=1 Tax=Actibacterium sp. 188UL27-1 TaxID=2786961 RepID=UPI00195C1E62|nr:hypothetical protein [Actibacterium sp. 188UL27-1]MBM7068158.1 hypothetical protein [Actibacterium sp. 188UL27-1]
MQPLGRPISPWWILIGALSLVLIAQTWSVTIADDENRGRIIAALIGFGGTFISAITGVLLFNRQQSVREQEQERQANRRDEEDAKREHKRVGRLAAALRAEISESLTRLTQQFKTDQILEALDRDARNFAVADGDSALRGMPAGVGPERSTIFEQHLGDIRDLPETVIWAIVSYYQNDLHLAQYLNKMTEGAFDRLAADRQRLAVVFYRDLGQDTLRSALRAKAMLDAFLVVHHLDDGPRRSERELKLARVLMLDRPTDQQLAEMLEMRQSRPELGGVLRALPSDDSVDHLAAFQAAIGIRSG